MAERTYLIDSHCHLHDQEFFAPAAQLSGLKNAKLSRVDKIVCIGTDHQDSLNAQRFVQEHPEFNLFWSYGIHPSEWQASRTTVDFKNQANPPIAIGEVGLDYHYGASDKKQQITLLEEMLQLAIDQNLPLIFHVREAFDDFFAIIGNFSATNLRGVVHSFTDNKKNLRRSLEHGSILGLTASLPIPLYLFLHSIASYLRQMLRFYLLCHTEVRLMSLAALRKLLPGWRQNSS